MMFRVRINKEHLELANELAKRRMDKCMKLFGEVNLNGKGKMSEVIGENKAHQLGALGEILFAEVFEAKIDLEEILIGKIDFNFRSLLELANNL